MRDWAAARSPGNGHLAGGVPRKRPPRPPVAPYAGNGHRGWGGLRKTATPRIYVNRSIRAHCPFLPQTGFMRLDVDSNGHGTHCAGVAAGVTNNGLGIGSLAGTGDSPFVEVSSVKVLSAGGMGTQKTIIAGIIEATDEGADVISLSLGGRSNQSSQRAYSAAVNYAHRNGAIVVAAAGNSNRDAKDFAPANAEGMITVAAIDQLLLRAPFSNRTENISMAIAAPGVGIYSTVPGNSYRAYSGTSMACPFVAGLIGVMKSIRPELTHSDAYRIINGTGRESSETRITGRIVQPAAALAAILP